MSAARKNASRLKRLRRLGVPIDGDYLLAEAAVRKLGVEDACPVADERARLRYVPPRVQRLVLRVFA